jgi:hypothetical protein
LEGQHTQEDDIAFSYYALIVEVHIYTKILLEGSKEVRLPGRHVKLEAWDLI